MKNTVLLPHCRWCSSQRRWVVKRPSPWPPEPLPEPMPGLGAMPPRDGGPLPSRSRIIPLPMMPRDPPGPRSLRLMSRRSSPPPPRVSRSRTALVFFSSTFSRTSPRNIMGYGEENAALKDHFRGNMAKSCCRNVSQPPSFTGLTTPVSSLAHIPIVETVSQEPMPVKHFIH